jgi:hypothetical protein
MISILIQKGRRFGPVSKPLSTRSAHLLFHETGKDYSNPRVSDFNNLDKPEEDMYDRSKVPRMPW